MSFKGAQARNSKNYNLIGKVRRGKPKHNDKIQSHCASRTQLTVYLSKVIHIQLLRLQELLSVFSAVIKKVQIMR